MKLSERLAKKGGDYADWVGYFSKKEIVDAVAQLEKENETLQAEILLKADYIKRLEEGVDTELLVALEEIYEGTSESWAGNVANEAIRKHKGD